MCLVSKMSSPKIAIRDIDVYKRMRIDLYRKRINQNHHYIYKQIFEIKTPCRNIMIPTLPYKLVAEGKESISPRFYGEWCISGGFIHAYWSLAAALYDCKSNEIVVKGTIPTNTKYFIGEDLEICAKEIYLKGIIQNDNAAFRQITKYLPDIPMYEFKLTFRQTNSSIEEEVKEPEYKLEFEEICV